jgi:hypothetical protein
MLLVSAGGVWDLLPRPIETSSSLGTAPLVGEGNNAPVRSGFLEAPVSNTPMGVTKYRAIACLIF